MFCPAPIASILLQILNIGLLRTRSSVRHPERATIEVDHIHNLPQLIENYSEDLLSYYWNVERISFLEQSVEADRSVFEPLWDQLQSVAKIGDEAFASH